MNTGEYERMFRLEDAYWWFVGRHRLVEALMRARYGLPGVERRLKILDVGCGTGAMSSRLTGWGDVVSADFSPLALSFSKRRNLKHLIGADAMKLPFSSNAFDVVVVMDVLEHLPDDCAALCEIHRVLKSGGRLIATVPAHPHLWSEHDVALMHFRRYRRAEVQDRVQKAGFRIEKLSYTMVALYPIVWLQRRLSAHRPPHDPPRAAMPAVPAPINAVLAAFLAAENAITRSVDLPFGLTILCVATKA